MSKCPASLSVKGASKLMSWFSPTFSGALVNATVLTLLFKSFAGKIRFSRGVSTNTARFLRFFSLETLPLLPPDGITDFGIALAKHCSLAFCSFFLQIADQKPFLTDHAITCGVKSLASFVCLWYNQGCHTALISKIGPYFAVPHLRK